MKKRNNKLRLKPKKKIPLDFFGKALDLPPGMLLGEANIQLFSNREAVIEGCRAVLDYDENLVRINTGSGIISFMGRGLEIVSFENLQVIIRGYILAVNYGE